jgi:hypothetical protein
MYGGSEIITRWGGRVRVQDSSDALAPHVRVFYESGEYESDQIHLNLMEAIELRDRLTQFIERTAETWGPDWLQKAMETVAQHRATGQENETEREEA